MRLYVFSNRGILWLLIKNRGDIKDMFKNDVLPHCCKVCRMGQNIFNNYFITKL